MVYRKVGALRPLLRGVQAVAIALAALDLLLLALRLAGVLPPPQALGARLFSAAVSLALLAVVLVLTHRLDRALAAAEAASRQQQQAFDALDAGIVLFDAGHRIVLCNEHFRRSYAALGAAALPGATYEHLLRAVVAAGMAPEAQGREQDWIAQRLAEFGRGGPPLIRRLPDGSWRRIVEQRLPDGGVLAHIVDVTDFERQRRALDDARQELVRSRQRLEDAIEAMPAGFELYDADDRLVLVNRTNLQMYPQLADLATSRPTFEQVVRTNAARGGLPLVTTEALDAFIAQRRLERMNPGDVRVQRIAEDRWVRVHERRTREGGLVAVRLDVSELMRHEAELTALNAELARLNTELSVLSHTDALTGLANRRAFDARLAEEVSRARRHGMPLALLLLDVDHFKRYNDLHGHPAGDDCLRRVAAVLRDRARRPTDLVARIGGEEFALLLPHEDAAGALALAEHCVDAVDAAAIASSPLAGAVTISVGVATLRDDVADAAALVAAADAALYRAKQLGRHRAVLSAPTST